MFGIRGRDPALGPGVGVVQPGVIRMRRISRWVCIRRSMAATALVAMVVLAGCDQPPPAPEADVAREMAAKRVGPEPPGLRQLESPVRIAPGRHGRVLVSDFLAETLVEFRVRSGELFRVRELALDGPPLGVAFVRNQIFVGNAATGSVDVYRANGKWLYALGGPGAFTDPTDIAADSQRDLVFVLDGRGRAIHVFDVKAQALLRTISGPGLGEYDLQNPTAIAVDPRRGEVLVSDYGEPTVRSAPPRLKIFGYDGAPLAVISGKKGMLGQRFSRPQGIAVDGGGHIFMVEAVAGEVQVLDRDTGNLVKTLGSFGSGPGELWLPLDVVLDEGRNVLVTNNRPGRIEVYAGGGAIP